MPSRDKKKNNGKPIEMHSHVMCLQTIENKSMLMHSNHMPKKKTNASNNEAKPNPKNSLQLS
jgi:hypothetical protein